MKKIIENIFMKKIFIAILIFSFVPKTFSQDPRAKGKTKLEYYNSVLAPQYGLNPLPKRQTQQDRKLSVLNVGNVWARISNAATLGYDRWGLCWEFPARSGITYRWTMSPMIGARKKDASGNYQRRVALGTRGAVRKSEEEFQPIKGYDSGKNDEINNIGIAFSDIPQSWPTKWPEKNDLPDYAKKVNYALPKVGTKGFLGINDGEVAATREAFFAVTDNSPGESNLPLPLDVRVDVWGLQYDDILNRNFIIFRQIFTNIGTDTLKDVYVGIHDDPDCPEQGSSEWTDDYGALIKSGTTGIPGYTPREDSLLWNFTYLWDGDDKAEGFIPKNVAWIGLKFLETPKNNLGKQVGVTTFQVFEYSKVPQGDELEYEQMRAGIMPPQNVSPHAGDYTQTPNSYGPDITYVVASGPFTLAPGESLPFSFASIHGSNKKDLFNNAILCQLLYNANYNSAEPPPEPQVVAVPGNKQVTLYWDDNPESGRYRKVDGTIDHIDDRLTKTNSFEGYKIYKSSDRGITWGNMIVDFQGVNRGIIPLAQYDLANDTTGESKHPLGRYFYLGEDSGLKHMFVDNNVNNGYEYWYAVCAYDHDDGPIPPLISSIKSDPKKFGDNTVSVIPQAPPVGRLVGNVSAGAIQTSGNATKKVLPVTTLNSSILKEDNLEISFKVESPINKRFSIKNKSTGNYILNVAGDSLKDLEFYNEAKDNNPIFNGLTIFISDTSKGIAEAKQTFPANVYRLKIKDIAITNPNLPESEESYSIEFTDDSVWSTKAGNTIVHKSPFKVPFKVRNISTGKQVVALLKDISGGASGKYEIAKGDSIVILNIPYKVGLKSDTTVTIDTTAGNGLQKATLANYCLTLSFDTTSQFFNKDIFTLEMLRTFSVNDKYLIAPKLTTDKTIVEKDLSGINVVPNPYIVSSPYEQGKYGFQKQIQFQRLPEKCTIKIFNIAGDHIKTIEHIGGTIESWNLQTYNEQEIAFGVYIFHVTAPEIGDSKSTYIGKFAVIK